MSFYFFFHYHVVEKSMQIYRETNGGRDGWSVEVEKLSNEMKERRINTRPGYSFFFRIILLHVRIKELIIVQFKFLV